eukprot:CAMPEP_0174824832 /NCGR_PEP_ID=MMETSP1107-20130205/38499_1 /TAXON_ID=36770 /ORGANISM="Paraphysomonas vestita, Strain GFlagA" /LENGTH=56 /DNA_ID=CAMNT_0016054245 /DNA_START=1651 /DNA_END=1821 /DNA_ORIENTATION=-
MNRNRVVPNPHEVEYQQYNNLNNRNIHHSHQSMGGMGIGVSGMYRSVIEGEDIGWT